MRLEIDILCTDYKHKKIVDGKIMVEDASEEYYVVPLTKSPSLEYNSEAYKLSFKNQLLWLKYSNHNKEILVKGKEFSEFIVIKAENILDIYMYVSTSNYLRKNVWQCKNNIRLNKKYSDKYVLMIPIIDEMINIKEFGVGIVKEYQIHMISNEVLLDRSVPHEHNCSLILTNNFLLNKDALFIRVGDDDASSFFE